MDLVITPEAPVADDVVGLLEEHLDFARRNSPSCHVHAFDLDGRTGPTITFFTARVDGDLLGVGALKDLGDEQGELTSMHTRSTARRAGIGRAMVEHLLGVARVHGVRAVRRVHDQPAQHLYDDLARRADVERVRGVNGSRRADRRRCRAPGTGGTRR